MSEPLSLLEGLSQPFPPHAIEQREGAGGRMLDYVATETVIRRLNRVAPGWDFRITDKYVAAKEDGSGLLVIWGELTIPGLGTRAGTGVQSLRGGEDMWKGAASDCLKKCATLFGVGIDLYGPDLEAGEAPRQRQYAPVQRQNGAGATQRPAQGNGNGQARQAPPEGNGITPAQIKFIHAIASDKGIAEPDLEADCENKYGVSIGGLDRRQASAFIDLLKQYQVAEMAS